MSGDMDVRDVAAERGAEREIATDTHVEDGIMKSLYDVAVKGDGALVGYKRFTGRVRYNDGDEAPEEPIGTVGSPLKSWRLSPGVVDESRWAVFSRRGIVWEDLSQLPR